MSFELYNDAIIAEAKAQVGAGTLTTFDREVMVDNPLCGDRIKLQVRFQGDQIETLAHKTRGCLLTAAAMSIVARHARGLNHQKVKDLRHKLTNMLQGASDPGLWPELEMLEPVSAVTSRHDCVLLALDALEQIFEQSAGG